MSIFLTIKQGILSRSDSKKVKSPARQRKELEQKTAVEKEEARAILIGLLDKGDRKNG